MPGPNPPTTQSIIGMDLTAYLISAGGFDNGTNVPAAGTQYTAVGKWESIDIEITTKFYGTTSSDAEGEQRRAGPWDWKATLSNMVRNDIGSLALALAMNNNWLYFTFTERGSGKTFWAVGGIPSSNFTAGAESWKDKLEVINVGYYPTYG